MYIKNRLLSILLVVLAICAHPVFAAAPIFVSTQQDTAITIDVSASLDASEQDYSSIDLPSVTAANGSLSQLGSSTQFNYNPPAGYTGADSFSYRMLGAGNAVLGTGSVTISVGPVDTGSVQGSANQAIANNLNTICIENTSAGQDIPATLVDLCSDFTQATPAELRDMASELAPKEIGGQNQLTNNTAKQQIDNVRKRMANLRIGRAGNDFSALRVQIKQNKPLNLAKLLDQERGGAAGAGTERLGVFGSGDFGNGRHDASDLEDGYELNNRGLTGGVDYRVSNTIVLGGALGLSRSQLEVDNAGGNSDIDGYSLLGYGSYYLSDKAYVEAIVAIYQNSIDTSRNVNYKVLGETRNGTAYSSTNNDMLSLSLGIGVEVFYRRGFAITVSSNFDYIESAFDGYAESGNSNANLIIDKRELSQTTYSFDTLMTYAISTASGVIIPQMNIVWKHEFNDDADVVQGRFRNDPNKENFSFNTEVPDSDYFKLNLGVSQILPGGNTGFIYYEKVLSKDSYSLSNLSLGIRIPLDY